jgi:hypothetical protein
MICCPYCDKELPALDTLCCGEVHGAQIPEFSAEEWFHIPRGDVAIVKLHEDTTREQLWEKLKTVIIDGVEYQSLGVESWAIPIITKGRTVGILVAARLQREEDGK